MVLSILSSVPLLISPLLNNRKQYFKVRPEQNLLKFIYTLRSLSWKGSLRRQYNRHTEGHCLSSAFSQPTSLELCHAKYIKRMQNFKTISNFAWSRCNLGRFIIRKQQPKTSHTINSCKRVKGKSPVWTLPLRPGIKKNVTDFESQRLRFKTIPVPSSIFICHKLYVNSFAETAGTHRLATLGSRQFYLSCLYSDERF